MFISAHRDYTLNTPEKWAWGGGWRRATGWAGIPLTWYTGVRRAKWFAKYADYDSSISCGIHVSLKPASFYGNIAVPVKCHRRNFLGCDVRLDNEAAFTKVWLDPKIVEFLGTERVWQRVGEQYHSLVVEREVVEGSHGSVVRYGVDYFNGDVLVE